MKYSIFLHALSFKLIWVGTIWLAANDLTPWAALLIWSWAIFWWQQPRLIPYRSLAVTSLAVGAISEFILCYSQVSMNTDGSPLLFPPFWLLGLWVAFGSLLPICLEKLHQRYALSLILGAVFGPLSYRAGSQWGALNISDDYVGILFVALVWGVSFPFLLFRLTKEKKAKINELT
jgi:hypothetical protein